MNIESLDHLVLRVKNIEESITFYTCVLGMQVELFKGNRKALRFGQQKINLHQYGHEFEPKACHPVPGSADLCFVVRTLLEEVASHLRKNNVVIIEGPVKRTGAVGSITSLYIRDPDSNLIELSNYDQYRTLNE